MRSVARAPYNDQRGRFRPRLRRRDDLFVNDRLDTAFSYQLTYGDPRGEGKSIIDRSSGIQLVGVDVMELFTLSPVPEPATGALLAAGLGLLGLATRPHKACAT